jgi:hypothetical protein
MPEHPIYPGSSVEQQAPHIVIEPKVCAPDGSVHLFDGVGYQQVVAPWAVEQHIPPINRTEAFGDVESCASYVRTYAVAREILLTWNERGLQAILDYHQPNAAPGRCQWHAVHPFTRSAEWQTWSGFVAGGRARSQREFLEFLEDNAPDVIAPDAATIVNIIRSLRTTMNMEAASELKADGSTAVSFKKSQTVEAGSATLPPAITIGIPLLKGHLTRGEDGKLVVVRYQLEVKVRPTPNDDCRLTFRLAIPRAEPAFETVFAERVDAAQALLAPLTILRAS